VIIEFQSLPPEHELSVASAALVALEDWRLVVHAHEFMMDDDTGDDSLIVAYVTSLGYHAPSIRWPAVPMTDLPHALSVLVWKEQAHGSEVVRESVAREAVTRWLAGFPQPYRAYANGDLLLGHAKPEPTGGWSDPIIGATFDTGAIVIGEDFIGMLWATDED
jgi:hypothetical protein